MRPTVPPSPQPCLGSSHGPTPPCFQALQCPRSIEAALVASAPVETTCCFPSELVCTRGVILGSMPFPASYVLDCMASARSGLQAKFKSENEFAKTSPIGYTSNYLRRNRCVNPTLM